MYWCGARRSVTGRGAYAIELRLAAGDNTDTRPYGVAVAFGAFEGQFQPMIAIRTIVDPQFGGRGQGGNDNIEFPVVIKVANRRATVPPRRLRREASRLRQGRPLGAR